MSALHIPIAVEFRAYLQDIAKNHGFDDYEIRTDNGHADAWGYTSVISHVSIVSIDKELNVVMKSSSFDDKSRAVIPIAALFKREIYMYETILPLFQQFEIERGIKQPTQFTATYYTISNKNLYHGDIVVLENLKKIGYSLYGHNLLGAPHIELGIKNYAEFHAISFAYRDQHPAKFQEIANILNDNHIVDVFKDGGFLVLLIKHLKDVAGQLDDQKTKNDFQKSISQFEGFILGLPGMVDEYSIIIHGDCWKNNIMFKYDEHNLSTPTDIRLLDFQLSRLASPMFDIANFLYGCGSKEVIDNMQSYLELYHCHLSKRLEELGTDPNKMYPFSTMMEHWKRYARYGLLMRASMLTIFCSNTDDRNKISEIAELDGDISGLFDHKISDTEKYKDLCQHSVLHFLENKLI